MSSVKPVDIRKIYRTIARAAGLDAKDPVVQRQLSKLLPGPVRLSDGRINELFLFHLAASVVHSFPECRPGAEELIQVALKKKKLTGIYEDLGSVYAAIVKEHETLGIVVEQKRELRTVNKRLLTLQNLVRELGNDPEQNIKIAARCIREALGYSGARVYAVDIEKGTWFHRYKEGEEGESRFHVARVPEGRSEKSFINKLLRSEIPPEQIEQARMDGLYDWQKNGEWAFLHIPDRSQCEFVEREQLARDENGDASQNRKGYGAGSAREILYLVLGDTSEERIDVYMITNWAARRPLFADKEDDIKLLKTFAAALSRSSQLASAYQKIQDTSLKDELTGINNRRFFNTKIVEEFARAANYDHPLSLAIFDIDHFKVVNDIHGHQAGDVILRAVAQKAKSDIRSHIDTIARYGGEEFAIILPETGIEGALQCVERIREEIQSMKSPVNSVAEGSLDLGVTVSFGIACFPEHAESFSELIFFADTALLEAKAAGRNQTALYKNTLV